MLDKDRIIELLRIERECVSRAVCDRDCGKCELAQDKNELLAAFDGAISKLIEQEALVQSLQHTIACMAAGIASTAPRVWSVADFIDNQMIPTVIWLEKRNGDVIAGVWQIDHYEMEDGTIRSDIGIEIAEWPEAYNTQYRIWTDDPNEACKRDNPWDDEKEGGGNT